MPKKHSFEYLAAIREGYAPPNPVAKRRAQQKYYKEYEARTGRKVSDQMRRRDELARRAGFESERDRRKSRTVAKKLGIFRPYGKATEHDRYLIQQYKDYPFQSKLQDCIEFQRSTRWRGILEFKFPPPKGMTAEQYVDMYWSAWVYSPPEYKPHISAAPYDKKSDPRRKYFITVVGYTPKGYDERYTRWADGYKAVSYLGH